jgi:hypothetical protein
VALQGRAEIVGILTMATVLKDIDGGRSVRVEVRNGSAFIWGRGFSYEFDLNILANAAIDFLLETHRCRVGAKGGAHPMSEACPILRGAKEPAEERRELIQP